VNTLTSTAKAGRRGRKTRRGAAAVEFAIVATVFFMFVFAIFEIGRLVMLQQIMGEACRQGARRAILENADESAVETLVTSRLAANSIAGATVTITWPGQDVQPALNRLGFQDPITVRATVPYSSVSWLIPTWVSQTAVMEAQSTMRIERPE
jgi:Flp pilus assembly protein TadG